MLSKSYPHPEERPLRDAACGGSSGQAGASRRTQDGNAALPHNSCPASPLFRPTLAELNFVSARTMKRRGRRSNSEASPAPPARPNAPPPVFHLPDPRNHFTTTLPDLPECVLHDKNRNCGRAKNHKMLIRLFWPGDSGSGMGRRKIL
jgi:hypothetical protein